MIKWEDFGLPPTYPLTLLIILGLITIACMIIIEIVIRDYLAVLYYNNNFDNFIYIKYIDKYYYGIDYCANKETFHCLIS